MLNGPWTTCGRAVEIAGESCVQIAGLFTRAGRCKFQVSINRVVYTSYSRLLSTAILGVFNPLGVELSPPSTGPITSTKLINNIVIS